MSAGPRALLKTLGAVGATLVAYVLAVAVFDFDYRFNPWLVPIGLVAGAGVLATRSSLRDPPIATLRKSQLLVGLNRDEWINRGTSAINPAHQDPLS